MKKDIIDISKLSFKISENNLSNSPRVPIKHIFGDFQFETVKLKSVEKEISKKKKTAIKWLKKKDNLILFGIMVFAIIIRLYYFWTTKAQALWWDEADYLAYSKTLANMGTEWIVTSQHNSLFSYIVALFFKIGTSELVIKFILEIIPSILLVFLTYRICVNVYKDKKIAVIAGIVMAVFWNILFNSMRFHLGAPALFFAFLAIYTFFVGYEKRKKIFIKISANWAMPLAVIFTMLSYSFRRNYAFFGIFFLIYILSTKKIKTLVKDKYNWIAIGIAAFSLILTEKFIFISSMGGVASEYYHPEEAFNFLHLNFLTLFFQGQTLTSSIFFWLAILGLIIIVLKLILSIDYIRKKDNMEIKFDFFLIISLVVTLAYFIFFQRGTTIGEPRWYFPILLASIVFVSKGAVFIYNQIKRYNKHVAVIVVILLVALGGYYQLQHADQIIKMKIPTYEGIKDAGLKLNEISNPEDVIISSSVPQTAYYSEKTVVHFSNIAELHSENEFQNTLNYLEKNSSIRYVVISFSESNNPVWARNEAVEYIRDANGQLARDKWEIPFMDTFVNFQTGEQNILQEKTYENITFRLVSIEKEVFIYEIFRL